MLAEAKICRRRFWLSRRDEVSALGSSVRSIMGGVCPGFEHTVRHSGPDRSYRDFLCPRALPQTGCAIVAAAALGDNVAMSASMLSMGPYWRLQA